MQYNEIEYGKLIKEKGIQGDNIKTDLIILSKYLYHIDKMKPKEHKEFVYEFCRKYIHDFNEVRHYKEIDSCIRKGRDKHKYPISIKAIPIHKEMLNKIDNYDITYDYKKVLLSLYVNRMIGIEKNSQRLREKQELNLCYYDNKRNNKTVFNSSRIGSTYKIKKVLKDLHELKIINDVGRSRVILEFVKDVEFKEVFYDLQSCDFDKIGWLWDYYKGEGKVLTCAECNKLIKRNGKSPTRFCCNCAKNRVKKQDRDRKRLR